MQTLYHMAIEMNILVIGCGKVGSRLASSLAQDGHDVSIVDRREENFELLDDEFEGFTTAGVPIDQDVLKRAGIENCDALAAVSQDDNVNIMVSQLAREIFHIPNVLARIYDPRREDVFSRFGLHTVCPTNLTVEAVRSALLEDGSVQSVNLGGHTITFHWFPVPKRFVNQSCSEVDLNLAEYESLLAVQHADMSISLAGKRDLRLAATDLMIIARTID